MALKDILAEVETILKTVVNIGIVHRRRRWAATDSDFLALFKDQTTGQVRAWEITRESTPANDEKVHNVMRRHQIVLRGYLSSKDLDASEDTFQELIESVFTTFLPNRKLNAKAYYSGPISVRLVGRTTFGEVLCHYCELVLEAQEYPVTF